MSNIYNICDNGSLRDLKKFNTLEEFQVWDEHHSHYVAIEEP